MRATLLAEFGGQLFPIKRQSDRGAVVVDDEKGVERVMTADRYLPAPEDLARWTPLDGWGAFHYTVKRTPADHRGAQGGKPLHLYEIEVLVDLEPTVSDVYWGLEDLDWGWGEGIKEEIVKSEGSVTVILAWWNPREQNWWPEVSLQRQGRSSGSLRLKVPASVVDGRPVLFVWEEGHLKPLRPRTETKWEAAFGRLRTGAPPTGEDLALLLGEGPEGIRLLDYAAAWGDLRWVESWVNLRVEQQERPHREGFALLHAARRGHAAVMAPLLRAGMRPTFADRLGFDAGHFAALQGFPEVLTVLLDNNYPVRSTAGDGFYDPISLSMDEGHDDIFGLLRQRGGNLRLFNRWKRDELLALHAYRGGVFAVDYLLSQKADPNAIINRESVLMFAINGGNPAVVARLLEAGANPNFAGGLPLTRAAISNQSEVVRLLLEAGAHPAASPEGGPSPVLLAVLNGNRMMVERLVAAGADPNRALPPEADLGLVEFAALAGHGEMVRSLFALGATCRFPPEMAEDMLVVALSRDLPEVAALAYESCVSDDFLLYGAYDLPWVIDYYGAREARAWLDSLGDFPTAPAPPIYGRGDLDLSPRIIQSPLPGYSEAHYREFGDRKGRLQIIVEHDGRALFPLWTGDVLPPGVVIDLFNALRNWKFEPGVLEGEAVRTRVVFPMYFTWQAPEVKVFEAAALRTPPKPISQRPPIYPPALEKSRQGGDVRASFVVQLDGSVRDVEIVRSTHPLLSFAAINAIRQWRFEPAAGEDGTPVLCRASIHIPFRMR